MNAKIFSEAMNQVADRYYEEAANYQCKKYMTKKIPQHFPLRRAIALTAAIFALFLTVAGAAVKMSADYARSPAPFENVEHHDLSADGALQISDVIENGELFLVPEAFTTNSEKISVTNHSAVEITAYLYSDSDPDNAIREIKIGSGKTKAITGLSASFLYHIGVTASETAEISITIGD